MSRPPKVVLVGISGCGKSAVAPLLAARIGGRAEDLDARIEAEEGTTIADLFARRGEATFRRLEARALARTVEDDAVVIACGGGVVVSEECRTLLRTRCRAVWLEVDPAEAARRISGEAARPLLSGGEPRDRLADLLAARARWYAEVASLRVVTDGHTPGEVAEAVARALGATTSRTT